MMRLNARMNLPGLQKIMMEFERQSEIMDMKVRAGEVFAGGRGALVCVLDGKMGQVRARCRFTCEVLCNPQLLSCVCCRALLAFAHTCCLRWPCVYMCMCA